MTVSAAWINPLLIGFRLKKSKHQRLLFLRENFEID
jgi:hypothetical protein